MNKAFKWIFVVAAALMAPIFMLSNGAFAASTENVFKKVLVNNVSSCYQKVLKSTSYEGYKKSGFNSLIGKSNPSFYVPSISDNQNKITETDEKGGRIATCDALFLGDGEDGWLKKSGLSGSMKSLFDIYGKAVPSSGQPVSVVNDFMRGTMQYTINTNNASSEGYCYTVYLGTTSTKLGEGCMNGNSYGADAKLDINDEKGDGYTVTSGHGANSTIASKGSITVKKEGSECFASVFTDFTEPPKFSNGSSIIEIDSSDRTYGKVGSCGLDDDNAFAIKVEIKKSNNTAENSEKVSYKKVNNNWTNFITALTGESYDSFAVSDAEKYDLYLAYLSNNYGMNGIPVVSSNCQASRPSNLRGGGKYYVFGGDSGWCEANLNPGKVKDNNSVKMTVFAEGNNRTMTKVITGLDELIEVMGALNYSDPSAFGESAEENGGPKDSNITCANSGGAMSLGWIVCPVLEWMGGATDQIYTDYVEPSLQIEPKLFSNDPDEGTRKAWGIFQTIANIIFIILLLAVIISQLTGVGIDNYGIKKILPKLIVAAILVNLSYYICLIFVDVSNIVGNSIQALFSNLDVGSPVLNIEESNAGEIFGGPTRSTAITGVAVLAALTMMVGAVWGNPAILLSLLVAALGVAISIFFLFLLLAAREAAIIVLVVISPVALVCYMLPNTKKVFDRWLKIGEALLLVYPIAGLLIGGGDFVSRLLLSSGFASNGFLAALTAMIVGIVPIFFIPTVLKNSFSAMGNLGAKITGFGDRLRGGVDRKIRNTEGYKNAQKMGLERRTRVKAGLDKNGNLTKRGERLAKRANGRVGRFIGSDKRRAAYIAAAKKDITIGEESNAALANALSRTAIAESGGDEYAYYASKFEAAAEKGDINGMNSIISAAVASGYLKDKDIAKIIRNTETAGKIKIADSATRAAWLRNTATKYGNGFLGTDFEMRHWMQGGGSRMLGDYGEYASGVKGDGSPIIGLDDIKPEDISKLSGDSLAGLATAGIIDQGMAQRAISINRNLSADKKIMLGALANGATPVNAESFKNEAKAAMNAKYADGGAVTVGGVKVDKAMRDAWVSVTPDDVNVVQNFTGGGQQFKPVNVNTDTGSTKPRYEGEDFDNNDIYLRGPDGSQKPPIE